MESKNLKDYLHLYLGREVQTEFGRATLVHVGILGSSSQIARTLLSGLSMTDAWVETNKLVLRPLSDMSKDEAKELATIYTGYHIRWVNIKDEQIIFNYHEGDEIQENVFDIGYSNGEGFRYLLSKGFDLFGLIEAGLAIKKSQ